MATREDVRSWLEVAKKNGSTHVIIVCDTSLNENYPVEVLSHQDAREILKRYNDRNKRKVMEVYNLSLDLEAQISKSKLTS